MHREARATVVGWLGAILAPGQVVEVRALGPFHSRTFATAAAGELERLADYALRLTLECKGVYFTPNPLRTTLCHGSNGTALDADVEKRLWLLIDVDSIRPKDTNATTEEKEAAWRVNEEVRATLQARGFQGIVIGDSGNGFHLMIPVDLDNTDEAQGLHRRLLLALKERFDTEHAIIDGKTHNAARIWKLPGTWARKGDESGDRVHRQAKFVTVPAGHREHAAANTRLLIETVQHWGTTKRDDAEAYIKRALDAECGAVSNAEVGRRNDQLNTSAFNLGQLVGGGALEEGVAESSLLHAAIGVGLPEDEARRTIRSGLEAGKKHPRGVPESSPIIWEEPLPLDTPVGLLPFPLDVFPPSLQRFASEQSWALNVPVDYLGLMMLCVIGGAIGNTKRLRIKAGYLQSAAVYGAFVARPGTKKSAVVRVAAKPLRVAEKRYYDEYKRQKEKWQTDGGVPPVRRRCITGGGTTEGIVKRLAKNSRGLTLALDELSGLISGLNQYKAGGKGNDRQFYLSAWDQTPYSSERVDEEASVFVARPFLCVGGAIQPDVLGVLRGEPDRMGNPPPDDGFFDRFLVAYPPEPKAAGELWREPTDVGVAAWESCVEGLLALRTAPGGEPQIVPLATSARPAYTAFTQEDAAEMNAEDFPDHLRGPWSKLMGYFGRFILILHTLDSVVDGLDEYEADTSHVERAAKLVRYFKSHAKRAACKMREDARVKDAELVRSWIAAHANGTVNRADIWKGLRHNHRFATPDDLDRPLGVLVGFGILRPVTCAPNGKAGRPRKNQYEINPKAKETPI